MKRILFFLTIAAALAAPPSLVLPGKGVGALRADTRRADVPRLLGLKEEQIADGTSGDRPSTEAWPMDAEKRLTLLWKGEILAAVGISGEKSVWKTAQGVTLGTRLSTLVKLNEKPLVVQSFEGEHSGEVVSYEGGKLAGWKKGMLVTLSLRVPTYTALSGAQKEALEKPGTLRSDSPLLKALNPAVTYLEVKL